MSVDVKYVGYDIPNAFVVGYGLDYAERYRNLRCIGTLAPDGLLLTPAPSALPSVYRRVARRRRTVGVSGADAVSAPS